MVSHLFLKDATSNARKRRSAHQFTSPQHFRLYAQESCSSTQTFHNIDEKVVDKWVVVLTLDLLHYSQHRYVS